MVSPSDDYVLLEYEYSDHASSDRIVTLKVTRTSKVQYLSPRGDVTREEDQVSERCRTASAVLPPFSSEFDAVRDYLCCEIKDTLCSELLLNPVIYDEIMPVIVSTILRDVGNGPDRGFCLTVDVTIVVVVQKSDMRWAHRYQNGASVIDLTRRPQPPSIGRMPSENGVVHSPRVPRGRGGFHYENGALIIDLTQRMPPPTGRRLMKQIFFAHQRSCTGCAICLEEFSDGMQISVLPCCHIFHGLCITMWFLRNRSCPTCRNELHD